MENNALQVFSFEKQQVRIVMKDGEPWFVAKDVAVSLGYASTNMPQLFQAVPEEWKGSYRIATLGGNQDMLCISEQGLYFFLARSDKPAALPFQKKIAGEILPQIRKTGQYVVPAVKREFNDILDLQKKRLDIMDGNSRIGRARALQEMIRNPKYPLTEESKRVLCAEAAVLLTGHALPVMLPDATEKLYSNADLGSDLGISNRKIMKLGRSLEIVAPEGQSNAFGRWKMTKSPYSSHECPQWYWTDQGRERIFETVRAKSA